MSRTHLLKTALALFFGAGFTTAQAPEPTPAVPIQPTPAPAPTWKGCTADDKPESQKVTIGEKTTICLVFSSSNNWNGQPVDYIRLSFQPIADEFSRFFVPLSYRHLVAERGDISKLSKFTESIAFHAASQTAVTFQKWYYDKQLEMIYPHMTAIIDVEDGIVKGITWDDGCIFCQESTCGKKNFEFNGNEIDLLNPTGGCAQTKQSCDDGGKLSTACDIAFHVVWTGTDGNGRPFESSAYRFSAFPKQNFVDNLNIPKSFGDLGIGGIGGNNP